MGTRMSLLSVSLAMLGMASASASILHVENNGVDGSACGDPVKPCRSISRAIQNARAGDTILVGPGLYGDINRDKDFLDPGDEAAEIVRGQEGCVVCIRKRLRILSTNGANVTRIDSTTAMLDQYAEVQLYALVMIAANGVTFGTPGHGFELTGRPLNLLEVRDNGDIAIAGNVARRTDLGRLDLTQGPEYGFSITATGAPVYITGNTALDNHYGFGLGGNATIVFTGNSALSNTWTGISVGGNGTKRLVGNFASNNGAGPPFFEADEPNYPLAAGFFVRNGETGDVLLEDNISVANFGPGFYLTNTSTLPNNVVRLMHNTATGNAGTGVTIGFGKVDVRADNIFGNLGAGSGCGLINQSGRLIDATQNFWGASTGPGADPADKAGAGSGCDQKDGSVTQVVPFATGSQPVAP
ncbi:MAG: right-handed parallel beta-helix repeat-containing protein [Gammaproteobacteria bacterium]